MQGWGWREKTLSDQTRRCNTRQLTVLEKENIEKEEEIIKKKIIGNNFLELKKDIDFSDSKNQEIYKKTPQCLEKSC